MEELKKLKAKIQQYKKAEKLRRVVYLACGLSGLSYISMVCSGSDFIDLDYIDCGIDSGLNFLALPFAIGDFLYHTIRKTAVTILLGGVGPLFILNCSDDIGSETCIYGS